VVTEVNVEFRAFNLGAFTFGGMKVIFVKPELFQFTLQMFEIKPDVKQSANEHVAADAAEKVEVKGLHTPSETREFI
jgi:hypothetical protein